MLGVYTSCMPEHQSAKLSLHPWFWLLAALLGFLAFGGWQPIFNYHDWSYLMSCDASKGSQTESFDAFALWLFLSLSGAFSGALIAFGYDFCRAKRIIEAIANPSLESVLDSSSQTQSALDEDCKT